MMKRREFFGVVGGMLVTIPAISALGELGFIADDQFRYVPDTDENMLSWREVHWSSELPDVLRVRFRRVP